MKKNKIKPIILFLVLSVCFVSKAKVFDERKGNTDVIYINDHHTEFGVKLFMINSAKKSIDISSFFLGNDYFGKNILFSLRAALERGVDIRIMHEGMNMRLGGEKDLLFNSQSILLDKSLKKKAQIISLNPIQKKFSGMQMDDCIHQKLLIVDAGFDSEKIYFGGRDLANNFSHMLDSGFLIRSLDKDKKYVGSDIIDNYNRNWNLAISKFSKDSYAQFTVNATVEKLYASTPLYQVPTSQFPEYIKIIKLLRVKPTMNDKLLPFQFRPDAGQVITNDFLIKILESKSNNVRNDLLETDDVLNFMYYKIYNAKDVQTASYSADFGHQIIKSLENVIKNSGRVAVFTDGKAAMKWLDTVTTGEFLELGVLSFLHSVKTMTVLSELAPHSDQLQFYTLNKRKAEADTNNQIKFLHRKLFLVDESLTLTGSHNFTKSSAEKNDELLVSFTDLRLNAYLRSVNEIEKAKYYDFVDLSTFPQKQFDNMKVKELILGGTVRDLY